MLCPRLKLVVVRHEEICSSPLDNHELILYTSSFLGGWGISVTLELLLLAACKYLALGLQGFKVHLLFSVLVILTLHFSLSFLMLFFVYVARTIDSSCDCVKRHYTCTYVLAVRFNKYQIPNTTDLSLQ